MYYPLPGSLAVMRSSRWRSRRSGRKGIAEIIGAILLIALTIVAGVILWSFRINTPPAPPSISFDVNSGSSHPAWGDPTDCQPQGTWTYPLTSSEQSPWRNAWYSQCELTAVGNFSVLNSTEFIISGLSSSSIPLTDVTFTFICNNASNKGGTTTLISGSLDSMIWFPGLSTQPPVNAPHLGYCGSFDAGDWSGVAGLVPANGSLYNRLGFFNPLVPGTTHLAAGDTFVLYLHNGGWPITYLCVAAGVGLYSTHDCPYSSPYVPEMDYDDYHGAPPWCFTTANACTIYLTYTGTPATILATIPVASLAPAPT